MIASDLLDEHVDAIRQASARLAQEMGELSFQVFADDARDLRRYGDDAFDLVLSLGPLYHLFDDEDIRNAISEAIRVCKPGGYLFFAYLPQDSIVLSYFLRHNKFSECFGNSIGEDFVPAADPKEVFRGFYPDEFDAIMTEFTDVEHAWTVATDGMSHQMREHVDALDDEGFEIWKKYCLHVCERRELLGYSNHALWIGRKLDR